MRKRIDSKSNFSIPCLSLDFDRPCFVNLFLRLMNPFRKGLYHG